MQNAQNQPPPKRHHTVPEFYQQAFCDPEDRLWVFDRRSGKVRRDVPANVAVQRYFYTVEGAGKRKHELETVFFRHVDGLAKIPIQKLDRGVDPSQEEKENLAVFVAMQLVRIPAFKRDFDTVVEGVGKLMLETMAGLDPAREDAQAATEVLDFLQEGRGRLRGDKNFYLESMVELGLKIARLLVNLNWMIGHSVESSFVTTDRPVTIHAPRDKAGGGFYAAGTGILTPGAVKVMPLTKSTCLGIGDPGTAMWHRYFDEQAVLVTNRRAASRCEMLVIGPDEQQIKDLVAQTGIDDSDPPDRVSFG